MKLNLHSYHLLIEKYELDGGYPKKCNLVNENGISLSENYAIF